MIFQKRKSHEIRWTYDDVKYFGKITIVIKSIKPYKNSIFGPSNSPSAFGYYVPNPICINGLLQSRENITLNSDSIKFVVPIQEIEEIHANERGLSLVLWMSSPSRCYKIEKSKNE